MPALSLIIERSNLDHEILITADELAALLEECDPGRGSSTARSQKQT